MNLKYFPALILLSLLLCCCDNNLPSDDKVAVRTSGIYAAGSEKINDICEAVYWINDKKVYLTENSLEYNIAGGIAFKDNEIYVIGEKGVAPESKPVLWKTDKYGVIREIEIPIEEGDIFVKCGEFNNALYVLSYNAQKEISNIKLWKVDNDEIVTGTIIDESRHHNLFSSDWVISEGRLYIAGSQEGLRSRGVVWEVTSDNKIKKIVSREKYSSVGFSSIVAINGKIMICGSQSDSNGNVPKLWSIKDEKINAVKILSGPSFSVTPGRMIAFENSLYVAGTKSYDWFYKRQDAILWKITEDNNVTETILTPSETDVTATAKDICITDSEIHIVGEIMNMQERNATVWRIENEANLISNRIDHGDNQTYIYSVCVKESDS